MLTVNYLEAFEKSEAAIKEIERHCKDIVFPSVNQLRYAAFHFNQSISANQITKKEQISKAINHCHRSYYDSYEAGIAYSLERIASFRSDYRLLNLADIILDFEDRINEVRSIQRWLATSSVAQDKTEYYKIAREKFLRLGEILESFESKRNLINLKIRSIVFKYTVAMILMPLILASFYDVAKYKLFPPDDCIQTIESICNGRKKLTDTADSSEQ